MSLRTFCKNVRFDVQVKEEAPEKGRYFDIELQMIDTGEFPKRALLPGKGMSVYKFQNREETDPCILMGDLCYTFRRYSDIKDESTREYMQYFATQKHESAKMKRIHKLVERYRRDPITRKAYMTLEQELEIRYKKKG